jgi:hypothetical protein
MIESLPYTRDSDGSPLRLAAAESLAGATTVASALGTSSAYTWLTMPACEEPDVVFAATTLPCVVVDRSLLHPPGGDVAGAVDAAAKVLHAATEEAPSP